MTVRRYAQSGLLDQVDLNGRRYSESPDVGPLAVIPVAMSVWMQSQVPGSTILNGLCSFVVLLI